MSALASSSQRKDASNEPVVQDIDGIDAWQKEVYRRSEGLTNASIPAKLRVPVGATSGAFALTDDIPWRWQAVFAAPTPDLMQDAIDRTQEIQRRAPIHDLTSDHDARIGMCVSAMVCNDVSRAVAEAKRIIECGSEDSLRKLWRAVFTVALLRRGTGAVSGALLSLLINLHELDEKEFAQSATYDVSRVVDGARAVSLVDDDPSVLVLVLGPMHAAPPPPLQSLGTGTAEASVLEEAERITMEWNEMLRDVSKRGGQSPPGQVASSVAGWYTRSLRRGTITESEVNEVSFPQMLGVPESDDDEDGMSKDAGGYGAPWFSAEAQAVCEAEALVAKEEELAEEERARKKRSRSLPGPGRVSSLSRSIHVYGEDTQSSASACMAHFGLVLDALHLLEKETTRSVNADADAASIRSRALVDEDGRPTEFARGLPVHAATLLHAMNDKRRVRGYHLEPKIVAAASVADSSYVEHARRVGVAACLSDARENLLHQADALTRVASSRSAWTGSTDSAAGMQDMKLTARLLRSVAEHAKLPCLRSRTAWSTMPRAAPWPPLLRAAETHSVSFALVVAAATVASRGLVEHDVYATIYGWAVLYRRALAGGNPADWTFFDDADCSLMRKLIACVERPDETSMILDGKVVDDGKSDDNTFDVRPGAWWSARGILDLAAAGPSVLAREENAEKSIMDPVFQSAGTKSFTDEQEIVSTFGARIACVALHAAGTFQALEDRVLILRSAALDGIVAAYERVCFSRCELAVVDGPPNTESCMTLLQKISKSEASAHASRPSIGTTTTSALRMHIVRRHSMMKSAFDSQSARREPGSSRIRPQMPLGITDRVRAAREARLGRAERAKLSTDGQCRETGDREQEERTTVYIAGSREAASLEHRLASNCLVIPAPATFNVRAIERKNGTKIGRKPNVVRHGVQDAVTIEGKSKGRARKRSKMVPRTQDQSGASDVSDVENARALRLKARQEKIAGRTSYARRHLRKRPSLSMMIQNDSNENKE